MKNRELAALSRVESLQQNIREGKSLYIRVEAELSLGTEEMSSWDPVPLYSQPHFERQEMPLLNPTLSVLGVLHSYNLSRKSSYSGM